MSSDFYQNSILPYAGIIVKICRVYSNSQEDFEDYYQEVCLQIWRCKDTFKGNSKWSTWIYRVSLNVCMTLQKKESKRTRELTYSDSIPEIIENELTDTRDTDLKNLFNAIKKLNTIDSAIIILFLEDKSYKEIATILGTNANNIGVRIKRIRTKLKNLMTNNYE